MNDMSFAATGRVPHAFPVLLGAILVFRAAKTTTYPKLIGIVDLAGG